MRRETDKFMELAFRYALLFACPTVWVICGMVASGKSTISTELSKKLGVVVLRSDLIRKDLFGLQPKDFLNEHFAEGLYTKEASSLTYSRLLVLAKKEIEKGLPVILDATFSRQHYREEVLHLAEDNNANIIFIECTAPEQVIKDRLSKREGNATVSDARVHHFKQFKSHFEALDELTDNMHVRVDTQLSIKENMMVILSHQYRQISKKKA